VTTEALTHSLDASGPSIIARLEFAEAQYPFFVSVSSLFVDLGLAHDLGVLLTHPEYEHYRFGSRFWMRNGRPIEPADRLRTFSIAKGSPLVLEIVISAVGGLWALTQIVDKVANWKLNRQKVELEVAKLRQEQAMRHLDILQRRLKLEDAARARQAERISQALVQRFEKSELVLRDIDLRSPRE
jgi:hypothetical protein